MGSCQGDPQAPWLPAIHTPCDQGDQRSYELRELLAILRQNLG